MDHTRVRISDELFGKGHAADGLARFEAHDVKLEGRCMWNAGQQEAQCVLRISMFGHCLNGGNNWKIVNLIRCGRDRYVRLAVGA